MARESKKVESIKDVLANFDFYSYFKHQTGTLNHDCLEPHATKN